MCGLLVLTGCSGELDTSLLPSRPWLEYERTGGLGGVEDHVELGENGVATVSTRDLDELRLEVPMGVMVDLKRSVEELDWEAIEGRHLAGGPDVFNYEVRFDDHVVSWTDADREVADDLSPMVARLNDIVSEARSDMSTP